jgi:hypothetical protein
MKIWKLFVQLKTITFGETHAKTTTNRHHVGRHHSVSGRHRDGGRAICLTARARNRLV